MNPGKSAIIIGSGVGGIATSIFLAQKGYNVSVFEKNLRPGGRCGQIVRDGHRFDIGASILLMPGLYRQVFGSLGVDFDRSLEAMPVDTLYKLFFDDGTHIEITTDLSRMEDKMELIEKGSYMKLRSYVSIGYRLYKLAFNKLLGRNFTRATQFINLGNLLLLFRLKAFINHSKYVRKFFRHRNLNVAFTFQNIYVGQSPYQAPALFSMLPAIELTEGSAFLKGGMHGIVTQLMKMAGELGVEFHFGREVERIGTKNGMATGVILADKKEIKANVIVANADLPYVYRELLPDKKKASQIEKKNYSCSAFVFHWGLDMTFPQLDLHNVFFSGDYRKNLDRIFKSNSLGDHPDFYIYSPCRYDVTAAPQGQDSISVIIPAGNINRKINQNWESLEANARSAVISRLKMSGIDIKDHIKFEISIPPTSWENQLNVTRGAVFGSLSHNIMQMGYFRPHNRHDRHKNLYFVGGSTHPGGGIPLVLLSAKLVSERIMKEN
ncbi:MAG TPA: phytoene desaturase family protein [Cyclobacteriaceae bacterium]|nr:phytoene desaturase family protein [Cyclobacteriaceae bacterium]